jgi:hypothetical protein
MALTIAATRPHSAPTIPYVIPMRLPSTYTNRMARRNRHILNPSVMRFGLPTPNISTVADSTATASLSLSSALSTYTYLPHSYSGYHSIRSTSTTINDFFCRYRWPHTTLYTYNPRYCNGFNGPHVVAGMHWHTGIYCPQISGAALFNLVGYPR